MEIINFFTINHDEQQVLLQEGDREKKLQLANELRKTKVAIVLSFLFAIAIFILWAIKFFLTYPEVLNKDFILLFASIYFFSLPFLYKVTGHTGIFKALIFVGGSLAIFFRSYLTGGMQSAPFYWLPLVPLTASLVFDEKKLKWAFTWTLLLSIVLFLGPKIGLHLGKPLDQKANLSGFIGILLTTTLVAFAYLRQRNRFEILMIDQEKEISEHKKLSSLGHMAAGVAHEINNPLMIISGNLHNAERIINRLDHSYAERDRLHKHIEKANNNITRINKIIQSLLSYSRMKSKDNFKNFALNDYISESKEIAKDMIPEALLKWDTPTKNLIINGELTLLTQVLTNLLQNAWQATQHLRDSTIKVTIEHDKRYIYIRVQDRGTISDTNIIENMFNPFFTTKPIGQGTGLGLSLSKGILEMHGGDLFLDIKQPTTTFVLKIPFNS